MMKTEKGRFQEKHAAGLPVDPEIMQAVRKRTGSTGIVTCADAAAIAAELQKTMSAVGVALDIGEISLSNCQLGLFGYHPHKKIVKPALTVAKELETAIAEKSVNGVLSCEAAWEIADRLSLSKMTVSAACEALKAKIKPCQLGAF